MAPDPRPVVAERPTRRRRVGSTHPIAASGRGPEQREIDATDDRIPILAALVFRDAEADGHADLLAVEGDGRLGDARVQGHPLVPTETDRFQVEGYPRGGGVWIDVLLPSDRSVPGLLAARRRAR